MQQAATAGYNANSTTVLRRPAYRLVALAAILTVSLHAVAQLHIIPQSRLDSVANPATLKDTGLLFVDGSTIDVGTIEELGGVWRTTVKYRNDGRQPLSITRIKTSCGCLTAKCHATTTQPNETGSLDIAYNPKGRGGEIMQRIFIYTQHSTTTPAAVLRLVGHVRLAENRSIDYPIICGALLLRHNKVHFGKRGGIERIACMNGGTKPLRITADSLFTSQGISLHCQPEVLQPKAEGNLIITLDTRQLPTTDGEPRLYIDGVAESLRNRKITITLSDNQTETE